MEGSTKRERCRFERRGPHARVAQALVDAGIVVVSLVGLVDSITFMARRPPILASPYARVFRWPNAVYGIAWYAVTLVAGTWWLVGGRVRFCEGLVIASVATVIFSAYLLWALVFRERTLCRLCLVGHACNAALLPLLWAACGQA